MLDNNFDVYEAKGSKTLHPYISETYQTRIKGTDEQWQTLTKTVTVAPGPEKYVIVGDSSKAEVQSEATAIKPLSTLAVTVQRTLPAPNVANCIVIDRSASLTPADAAIVKAQLQAGKGVVLLAGTPCALASGDLSNSDVSAISSWFGAKGVNRASGNMDIGVPKYVPVPITTIHGGTYYLGSDGHIGFAWYTDNLLPGTDPYPGNPRYKATDSTSNYSAAFGFRPAIGGRVFWMEGGTFEQEPSLLAAAARWTAIGP
jgi:hypothetical protein